MKIVTRLSLVEIIPDTLHNLIMLLLRISESLGDK